MGWDSIFFSCQMSSYSLSKMSCLLKISPGIYISQFPEDLVKNTEALINYPAAN